MIKAVIFDMDGVIVDSEPLQSLSLEVLLKEYGQVPIRHKNGLIQIVGAAGDDSYKIIMKKHSINDSLENFKRKRRDIYERLLQKKLSPMPGFKKAIRLLQNEKIRIALASSRNFAHIHLALENLGITHFFEVISGPSLHLKHKPAPDIYLAAAKKLRLKPSKCIAIEDSEIGVLSAYTAGMKIIAVPTLYTRDHDFSKAHAIVESLQHINRQLLYSL